MTKSVHIAAWVTKLRKSMPLLRPRASTELSERHGTQTPSLALALPHPGSSRRGSRNEFSYSYVNESGGIYGPGPCYKDCRRDGVRKDCVHISGLEVEGHHPRALMESALVCLKQVIGLCLGPAPAGRF